MSPRDAAAQIADRATLHIRELKFSGVGRWLTVALLVLGGAGSGAGVLYGFLGLSEPPDKISISDVTEVASAIREDMRAIQVEQRDQGNRLGAALERLARIETIIEEMRRRAQ